MIVRFKLSQSIYGTAGGQSHIGRPCERLHELSPIAQTFAWPMQFLRLRLNNCVTIIVIVTNLTGAGALP